MYCILNLFMLTDDEGEEDDDGDEDDEDEDGEGKKTLITFQEYSSYLPHGWEDFVKLLYRWSNCFTPENLPCLFNVPHYYCQFLIWIRLISY